MKIEQYKEEIKPRSTNTEPALFKLNLTAIGDCQEIFFLEEHLKKVSRVGMPSETLPCEQDAEYGRMIKEKLKSLETENIPADMWIQCTHVLVRSMAETNSEIAKVTITNFELLGKLYGDYEIKIKRLASKS